MCRANRAARRNESAIAACGILQCGVSGFVASCCTLLIGLGHLAIQYGTVQPAMLFEDVVRIRYCRSDGFVNNGRMVVCGYACGGFACPVQLHNGSYCHVKPSSTNTMLCHSRGALSAAVVVPARKAAATAR